MLKNKDKTVLILSTYPIKKPFHGGQHRLKNLEIAYQKAGYKTINIAFFDKYGFSTNEIGKYDIPIGIYKNKEYLQINNSYFSDYFIGSFTNSDKNLKYVLNVLENTNLYIIHLEQPWLFKLAKKIKEAFNNKIFLVYDSQNIENQLKKQILEETSNNKCSDSIISSIKKLEIEAANYSDLTLVVSNNDLIWLKQNATNSNLILVPNGVRKIKSSKNQINKISNLIGTNKWLLYTGSAHVPNLTGFLRLLKDKIGFLPPDFKFLIIGGVGHLLEPVLFKGYTSMLNQNKCCLFYNVNNDFMDAAVIGAHAILLPILSGGGSNLKTAEALISGNYIIGTSKSFQSYEEYINLSGIYMSDNRSEFIKNIHKVINKSKLKRSEEEQKRLKKLYWSETTKPLITYLNEL